MPRSGVVKHGDTKGGGFTKEYTAWFSMKDRCYNKNSNNYHRYGARGVRVCNRWRNKYENFLKDMGRKPTPNHSLGRINNKKGYSPGNCRWETRQQQQNNIRTNRFVEYNGVEMTVANAARAVGFSSGRLHWYVCYRGLSVAEAVVVMKSIDNKNKKA